MSQNYASYDEGFWDIRQAPGGLFVPPSKHGSAIATSSTYTELAPDRFKAFWRDRQAPAWLANYRRASAGVSA